jgi:AraC-like DNA-binding protein
MIGDALTASRYLAGVQQMLSEQGIPASALLQDTGLTPAQLDDPAGWVTVPELDRFLERAMALSGLSRPGIMLGRRLHISAHGAAGMAGLTAPDARAALRVALRFFPLITEVVSMRMDEGLGTVRVTLETLPGLPPRCEQFVVHTLFSSLSLMAGFLLGPQADGLVLECPGPNDDALRRALPELGGSMRFGAPCHRIVLPQALLDLRFALANATAHQTALTRCEDELTALTGRQSWTNKLLLKMLQEQEGFPTLDQLAERMAVSTRTLHRRLASEGTSFRALLNAARMSRAQMWLRQGRSVIDVAHALGYGDSANFSRAFRRHHGVAPSQFGIKQPTSRSS